MVYTANWGIICYLPPIKGTRNSYWDHSQKNPLQYGNGMGSFLGRGPTFFGDPCRNSLHPADFFPHRWNNQLVVDWSNSFEKYICHFLKNILGWTWKKSLTPPPNPKHQSSKTWLVVSTHLKNMSQNGNLPQIGMNIKNIWKHHPKTSLPTIHLRSTNHCLDKAQTFEKGSLMASPPGPPHGSGTPMRNKALIRPS